MENNLIRKVKMAAYYSFLGLILQGVLVNLLFAIAPAEGQNLRDVKVSINAVDVSLEQALQILQQKTKFKFIFFEEGLPLKEKATVLVDDESLYNTLEVFAKDYGLTFNRINDQIIVRKSQGKTENLVTTIESGSVKGKVTDSATGEGLVGASVLLRGTYLGASTDAKGNYTIDNIKPGKYTIAVTYIGYATISKTVVVSADQIKDVNFAIKQSKVDLDEIVVSGGFSEIEKRAMVNPVTTISEAQVQALPSIDIADILQNKVPGFYQQAAIVDGNHTYGNGFRGVNTFNSYNFSLIQYYIDGIPIISGDVGSRITDLNNIEKIEVLRGPMATTLYGSRTSSGVVNITTKKNGDGKMDVNLLASLTATSSKYSDKTPLRNQQTLEISGGTAQNGYNLSCNHWDKDYQNQPSAIPSSTFWQLSGNARTNFDPFLVDVKLSYTKNTTGNFQNSFLNKVAEERGWDKYVVPTDFVPNENVYSEFSGSLNIKQILSSNWFHSLTIGAQNYESPQYDIGQKNTQDAAYSLYNQIGQKYTVRYVMNYIAQFTDDISADLSAGAEHWKQITNVYNLSFAKSWEDQFVGGMTDLSGDVEHSWESNYGYFAQGVFGYANKLFLTTGVRIEYNTGFAEKYGDAVLPRVGLTYVQELGDITIKPRVSWGSNITPPSFEQVFGNSSENASTLQSIVLPNPDLVPEKSRGYEIGADIYYGNLFSLETTYYNQSSIDLLYTTYTFDENYTLYMKTINLNKVFSKGFEISGTLNLNPFTFNLTFTSTDNTVGAGASDIGYFEGQRMKDVPVTTCALEISYKIPSLFSSIGKGGSITLHVNNTGAQQKDDYLGQFDAKYKTGAAKYVDKTINITAYTLLGLTANYWATDFMQVYVDVKNLTKKEDLVTLFYPMPGRQSTLGVKFNF